jgi:uncharacterized protein YjiK
MKQLILYTGLVLLLAGCQPTDTQNLPKQPSGRLRYDVQHPNQKFFMPDRLEEISGITYSQPNELLCVQDEEGKVFVYDMTEKRVKQSLRFGKDGDYEDLALLGKDVYVVKSNGVLHRFALTDDKKAADEELPTPLNEDNDIEGLCLDAQANQLWLACKSNAGIGEDTVRGYAVYAYDLARRQLDSVPVIRFQRKDIEPFVTSSSGKKKKMDSFKPSAIAIHPLENRVYVLSANSRFLVVLNRDGTVFEAIALSPKVFRQPEGLCFSPEGEMYISSEGNGQAGYILRFEYLR